MVAETQQLHHQQQQVPQAQSQPLSTAEEEALKRNTDCVYFLASPLTCKKGSECEYRHSEYARVNPRDCWFWINGNCLNPKCSFRHPPLDGLLGTHAEIPGSSSATPSTQVQAYSGKQPVPCIFFQKGLCLKGDHCAFLHGPSPITTNRVPHTPAVTQSSERPSVKQDIVGLEKHTQEQKIPRANVSNIVLVPPPQAKPTVRDETTQPRSGVGTNRSVPIATGLDDETSRYRATNAHPVTNGGTSAIKSSLSHQMNVSVDHGFQNGKDSDELLRESSPGFDVLVDNDLRESGYYHGEEQFGRTRGHEGRNLNSVNEYDMSHSPDYNAVADVDRERYRDVRGYDYDHMQGKQYAWGEQNRASSERILMETAPIERRGYWKSSSPDRFDESDLRYRLSKHRRVNNGLRSVISNDNALDNRVEERNHRGSFRRVDSHHFDPEENTISSRLLGRIKIPSPVRDSNLRPQRETNRGRYWGRLSPGRLHSSSHQGRFRDEMKGCMEENYNNDGRSFGGPRMRREMTDDRGADFAGPKRLADLKGKKGVESTDQRAIGKRKSLDDREQYEGDLPFEGPKPLSEILKRKRGAEAAGKPYTNSKDNSKEESGEILIKGSENPVVAPRQETKNRSSGNKEESETAPAESVETDEGKFDEAHYQSSRALNRNITGDKVAFDEKKEDHEIEADEQRDGEYDYEQVDEGEEYNYEEEGDNAAHEEEYLDDEEDGDDFAQKIGVMSS